MAQRLGVANRIRWLGNVSREHAPQCFRDAHAYVMPSLHESFGVVYAEALASGKPVIATRCGGPEYIVHEKNGRLVDVSDVNGLARELAWMAENWDQFDSTAIRSDFERRFSRPVVVGQLKALYESVIGS
jgi:glycosyltransferase involved in cell wall biosynthesis